MPETETVEAIIDTNILVYAWGVPENPKKARALAVLEKERSRGALTTQVLSEFAATMLRHGQSAAWVERVVMRLTATWTVLQIPPEIIVQALEGVSAYRLSFWDAVLWATARHYRVNKLVTEDGPSGAIVGGVVFINPFAVTSPPGR